MKWEMDILSPASYHSSSNWLPEESKNTKWTPAENKAFENALAIYDKETPDRWYKVAAMIPGKTIGDVIKQYKELELDVSYIEAGLIPVPGYSSSPFTLDWVNGNGYGYDGFKQSYGLGGKRSSTRSTYRSGEKERGSMDRGRAQAVSDGLEELSGGKDKRRASIHDITTVNLNETRTPSPENKITSPDQSGAISQQPNSAAMPRTHFQWNQPNIGATLAFNSTNANMFMSSPYGINSYGLKMQGQNPHRGAVHDSYSGQQTMGFQMQSSQHYPHG
ncbi:hypothetical protein OIU77_028328 [Salix suchowensis]|uniref:Myb-like domain-containing protein n=1 Tax=Salix suchowensis TaxID=1278906 RepID=A0ABQ9BH07_9ROSI|nr:hypothetical protein OIU77_028328 [Salix suchowensis]